MVDTPLLLGHAGHRGRIVALSRRGLLPAEAFQPHACMVGRASPPHAPALHARVSEAVKADLIEFLAGRLIDVRPAGDRFKATARLRSGQETMVVEAARLNDCTGISKDLTASTNQIVRSLVDRGLARPDPMHIGLDVKPDCSGRMAR